MPSTEAENDCRPVHSTEGDTVSKEVKQFALPWERSFRSLYFIITVTWAVRLERFTLQHITVLLFLQQANSKLTELKKNYNSNQGYYLNDIYLFIYFWKKIKVEGTKAVWKLPLHKRWICLFNSKCMSFYFFVFSNLPRMQVTISIQAFG